MTLHVLKVSKSVSESVSENNGEFVSLYKKFQFSMSLDNSWPPQGANFPFGDFFVSFPPLLIVSLRLMLALS